MGVLVTDVLAVMGVAVLRSVPWLVGVVVAWRAYRRNYSSGCELAFFAFGGLVVLQMFDGARIVFQAFQLRGVGWIDYGFAYLGPIYILLSNFARAGFVIVVALAFSYLVDERRSATSHS